MGKEALTALFIILPPHYVRSHDLRRPASEKRLQLQNHFATLSEPCKMESRKRAVLPQRECGGSWAN